MESVESFVSGDFICFGEDDEDGEFTFHAPIEHHHIVFGGGPSDIEEEQETEELFSFCEIIVHHGVPLRLNAFGDIGVTVTGEVDEVSFIIDCKEVNELCTTGGFADASEVFLFAEHIEEGGFSDVRTADDCDFGEVV